MAIINNRFQPAQNFVRNESVKGKKEIELEDVKLKKPGKTEEEQPNYEQKRDLDDLVKNGKDGDFALDWHYCNEETRTIDYRVWVKKGDKIVAHTATLEEMQRLEDYNGKLDVK